LESYLKEEKRHLMMKRVHLTHLSHSSSSHERRTFRRVEVTQHLEIILLRLSSSNTYINPLIKKINNIE